VYNIQKAVSRLEFAPKLKEIQVTDIKKGIGIFTPKADRAISFAALQTALKKAGYTLDSAEIALTGKLLREGQGWWLIIDSSGQRFALEDPALEQVLAQAKTGEEVEVTGGWKTVGTGAAAREVIAPRTLKKAGENPKAADVSSLTSAATQELLFEHASFNPAPALSFANTLPGLTLPTGKKSGPDGQQLSVSNYVRQQLTPINGGLSSHFDATVSQAQGRFIFGGNSEAILRSERAGYRTGHEVRINTDLEYVLLPRNYPKPGGELFAILETNFVHRGTGRAGGVPVQEAAQRSITWHRACSTPSHPGSSSRGAISSPSYATLGRRYYARIAASCSASGICFEVQDETNNLSRRYADDGDDGARPGHAEGPVPVIDRYTRAQRSPERLQR
jgi:hypothetical protein